MRLTRDQIADLRNKSPQGIYQTIRDLVREEHGVVDRDELAEALEDAEESGLLDRSEIRRFEDEG